MFVVVVDVFFVVVADDCCRLLLVIVVDVVVVVVVVGFCCCYYCLLLLLLLLLLIVVVVIASPLIMSPTLSCSLLTPCPIIILAPKWNFSFGKKKAATAARATSRSLKNRAHDVTVPPHDAAPRAEACGEDAVGPFARVNVEFVCSNG